MLFVFVSFSEATKGTFFHLLLSLVRLLINCLFGEGNGPYPTFSAWHILRLSFGCINIIEGLHEIWLSQFKNHAQNRQASI